MKAEIITIGDEILIGQVVDTNSAWIAQNLIEAGFDVVKINSISDKEKAITDQLAHSTENADLVILTGGLGPTRDDITKKTLAKWFNSELVLNHDVLENIKERFRIRGFAMNELNEQQALVPDCCKVLPNNHGTAPGMRFEKDNTIIVSLPGVPYEMKALVKESVLPDLSEKFADTGNIIHETMLIYGIGESHLAKKIESWENNLPVNTFVAYLPSPGYIRLRLTGRGMDTEMVKKNIASAKNSLKPLITEYIIAEEDITFEKLTSNFLIKNRATLCTAESCTGGYIAHMLTSIPGSSEYFKGSLVAYANEIKQNMLNVPEEIINEKGAVSKEVVEIMAASVREQFKTDYSIAVSGIAGPSGGTSKKPVGTVWIALASAKEVIARKYLFGTNRERNIHRSAISAFNMLIKILNP